MPFVPEENPGVTRPTQQTTAYSVAGKQYNIPSHWLNNPNFKRAFERAGNEGRLWTPPSTNQYAPERELQVIPQNRSYWESPQRVARYYDLIRSAPPTWTPPDWMNTDAIKEAYEYMRYRNDFKPVNEWAWLPEDDPASYFLKDLQAPPNSALWTNEKAYAMMGVPTQAEIDQNKPLDWASMPLYQQILVGILSPETGIEERPEWTRIPAAFVQAAMAAPAGTAIGAAVAGLPGAAIGTALVGGLTFAQAYFGKEIPGVTQFLEIMDAGAIFAERVVGLGKIGSEVGFAELMKMLPEAYKASSATYETQELDLVNKIVPGLSKTLDWMHEHAMLPEGSGWEGELAKANEVWQIQKGFTTPQPLEGERGVAALLEATAMLQRGDPFEQVYAEMVDRFGYSGTLNDFIEQSMIDPAFLAPGVGGRAGEFIARATGNERLAQAFNMTKGSLLIDALPPGLQQIVQAASGVKGSEGILTGVRLWKDWVQTGYYPATMFDMPKDMRQTFEKAVAAGVDPKDIQVNENKMTWTDKNGKQQTYTGSRKILVEIPDVDRLTSMERFIGGIDLTYGIKELKPSFERKGIAKLVSLDPASQAHVLLNLYHTVTATLFDRANGDPFQMGDMLRQLMGEDAVKAGDPGEMILKSPAARAVRDATKAGAKIAKYEEQLAQWQAVAGGTAADGTRIVGKRDILLAIADALGEKPADILTQLQNNPDVLMARLAETTGIPGSPEYIKETLSAFIGDNPLPWNEQQFQVRLINTIADAMSEYMQKVYGLKPDPALIRVGQVLKGVQSLVLLGFNPGYFFNNEVNNIVTRAAVGVFGYMTPKQISDYYTRLGIEPSRLRVGASPGDEGATYGGQQLIVDLKDSADAIGKANKAVRAVTRKLGIFSRMSAHMESIEGANSFTIGTKQFMQKAWRRGKGFRKMHPAVEAVLDQNFPGMKAIIYSAIEAGINMTEINSAIYGEYIKPSLRTAAEEAAKKVFPNNPDIGMDILERTGLLDKIEDRLQTAETPEKIDAVFRGIQDDLRSLIDEKWSTDVIAAADHAKNMVDAEKLPAVQEILGNFERKTGNMWLQHRRQWDMLYAQRLQLSAEQWSTQVSQLFDQQDREWRNHYAMRNQTYKGIMDALGIDTQLSRDYLTSMTQIAETWNEFHTEAGKLRKKYFDGNKRDNSEEYQKYRIRRDREWNTLQDELDELYEKHSAIENSIQTKMDTYLSDGFETYTGWNPVRVRAWRSYIRALRSDMVKMQREMRKKTRTMDADERDAAYAEFNPAYNKLIADMKRAEILGSAWIRNRPATAETLDSAIKDIKTMIQGEEAKPQQKPQGKKKQPERTPAEKEKEGVVEPEPALRPDPNEELWVLEEPWAQAAPIETEPVTVAPTEEGEPAPVEPPAQPKPQKVSEEWAAIGLAAREAGIVDKMGNIPTRYLLNVFNKHMRESGRPEVTRENLYLQEPKLVMDAINRHKNKHITNPVDVAKKATIRATLDEIANQASSQKREALLKQNGMLTRREIRARLEKMEKVTPDEIDAAMLLMDMYADVYMKRMGYIPTEGTRDAWYATRIADILFDDSSDGLQQNNIKSPEFVKWFGNSKVKTVHDEPIRMYHGTANLIFDTFDMSYTDADALFGPGFYFTDNPEVASSYTDTKAPKLQWLKDPIETEKIILDRLHEAYESKRITTTDPNLYQYFAQNHRKYSLATWISMDIDVSDLVIDLNHPGVFPVYLSIQNPFDIDAHMTEQEYADILIEVANYIKGTTDLVYKVNPANALLEEAKKIKENNVAGLRKGKWVYETIYNLVQYKKNIVNEILQRAGYDGIKHTGGMYASLSGTLHQVYIAFKPEQIKSVFNYGGWDVTDPNILHQGPKGTTRLLADARSIINLTKAADITTVVHEVAHIWRRDLSDADVEIIARMGGLDTVQFRQLEQEFHHGEKGHKYKEYRTLQQLDTLTNEQQARLNELTSDADVLDIVQYVKTEETFARGFERYLAEGYAPTPALRSLFKKFSAWLRKIYTNLFRKDGRVQGFEGTDLAVDIQTQVAGRSLRDIYDSMLVEKPSRLKTLDNLIEERAASLKNQSNNWKLSPEELSMLARKQVLDDILSGYENIEDARTFAEGLSDGEWVLSDGTTVDVADVFDAIRMAENIPSINPFEKRKIDQVEGSSTQAHGIKDVTKVYQFKWAVVDMGKITPSHKIRGGKIEINGEYPQIYQPRARESLEYFKQVQTNAALLVPQDLPLPGGPRPVRRLPRGPRAELRRLRGGGSRCLRRRRADHRHRPPDGHHRSEPGPLELRAVSHPGRRRGDAA